MSTGGNKRPLKMKKEPQPQRLKLENSTSKNQAPQAAHDMSFAPWRVKQIQ